MKPHKTPTRQEMPPHPPYRHLLLLLFLFVIGTAGVWGQTDYSGTYYIAMPGNNNGYNSGTPANNFYLVPTEGWCYYVATNSVQASDNGQPFLTTYQCGLVEKAKWTIIKHPTENYYYIKHVTDGKYLTYNGTLSGAGANRARVHLEASITDDNNLFSITEDNDGHYFISNKNDAGQYLNVTDGNKNSYLGASGKTDGPTGYKNVGGIIGRWNEANNTSQFCFDTTTSIAAPTITNNFNGTFTISAETGATIYYTTDGTSPTTSTPTSGITSVSLTVNQNSDIQVIKAIAKGVNDNIATTVTTYELPICGKPIIQVENNTVTITALVGSSIFYTIDNTEATASGTPYNGPFTISSASSVIRAIATKLGYYKSSEAILSPTITVYSSSEITVMTGSYILGSGFSSTASIGTLANPFKGTIDGNMETLSGLHHPLVAYADGATIKNVILKDVSISSGTTDGDVGAICCVANGATYIYNCGVQGTITKDNDGNVTSTSSTIRGSRYVGSIVGSLNDYSRVINCYSFATVSNGSVTGGIVGYNSYASKSGDIRTMVMNCMFYGTGENIYPIYGGEEISNEDDSKLNNYNYFSFDNLPSGNITQYNRALAAEGRYLDRFEFYRMMLNSNRELAAYYIDPYPTTEGTGDKEVKRYHQDLMAKWVLDKGIAPYPILKRQATYPSVINYNPDYTYNEKTGEMVLRTDINEKDRNQGRYLGDLSVVISGVGTNAASGAKLLNADGTEMSSGTRTISLKRTDKDFDDYNFNYNKVQLPYYNDYGTRNYTDNKVVTGWVISFTGAKAVSTGEDITFDSNGDITDTPYNFADRKAVTGRVFAQGAYFDVPDDVSSITITPHWAKAVYLSDATYDCYGYETSNGVTDFGKKYVGGEKYSINGDEQYVYTDISTALTKLSRGSSGVYDYAVVLVGNYHKKGTPSTGGNPYTIMSADLNFDNEPDYSLIINSGKQERISPIRFDFVNVIGTSMAHKQSGAKMGILGNMKPDGWFEVTNTAIIRFSQFEYDYNTKSSAPLILLGGAVEQFVSTNATDAEETASHTQYIHVGSNVWFKLFSNGCHMDKTKVKTPHRPISVTGGDYEKFYLSGYFQPNAPSYNDNAECYIDGGRFGEAAGAGQEKIQGNVTWIINHADITSFFGGGINDMKPIGGNVRVDINNSYVDLFCGGPKFGDMETDKTVTTNADNCNFGTFFGAGYGGTALYRDIWSPGSNQGHNQYKDVVYPWLDWLADNRGYTRGRYEEGKGIAVSFEYEHFEGSQDNWSVARLYVYFASLSLAQTNDVTSNLTNCIVRNNYYGGGNLGKVNGNITNNIDGCTIYGNVFGGGFSATVPTAEVFDDVPANLKTPTYNVNTGVFEKGDYPAKQTLTWSTNGSNTTGETMSAVGATDKWIHTDAANLEGLGLVEGNVFVNISNNTYVRGMIDGIVPEPDNGYSGIDGKVLYGIPVNGTIRGGVFGGGDASGVNGNTIVTINNTKAEGIYNVFGGGNQADVSGAVTVNMINGIISHDVYGGGALASTNTGNWNSTSASWAEGKNSSTNTTTVNLHGGTINGNVYGGGLGQKPGFNGVDSNSSEIPAYVYGDVLVKLNETIANDNCVVKGNIFGCNNVNGSPKGTVTVHVFKTQGYNDQHTKSSSKNNTTYDVAAVYGGGNMAMYEPVDLTNGKAEVIIDGCDLTSIEFVYGGSNAASVPATHVIINSCYEIGSVFGGGNGFDALSNGTPNPGADVGYKASVPYGSGKSLVELIGGTIHYAFGGSNTKGNVCISSTVTLSEKDPSDPDYCQLILEEVYGAGNKAEQDGSAEILLGCTPGIAEIYGGSREADINRDIVLTITSGTFDRVFGGNNLGGTISGTITVNIEETGCHPIIIGQLYGGGNQAAYTAPWEDDNDHTLGRKHGPTLNIKSFTSIGEVYGGGYGESAVVTGDTYININECIGDHSTEMGAIGTIFGGGNAAKVVGDTHVNIGTLNSDHVQYESIEDDPSTNDKDERLRPFVGAKITGNVYGGGNNADVTGHTNVTIGREN